MKYILNLPGFLLLLAFLFSSEIVSITNFESYTGPQLDKIDRYNSTNLFRRIAVPAYFLIVFILWARSYSAQSLFLRSTGIQIQLLVLFMLMLLSVFISDMTSITIRRCIFQILLLLGLIFNVYLIKRTQTVYEILAYALAIVLLANLFFLYFVPYATDTLQFRGFHTDKNTAGHILALSLVCFASMIARPSKTYLVRLTYFALFVAAFYLLLLSESKTSLGIVAIFIAFSIIMYWSILIRICLAITLYIFCISISLSWIFTETDPEILTNRGEIWNFLNSFVISKLYTGYGYQSFWAIGDTALNILYGEEYLVTINTAHNGFIDLLLSFGILGFVVITLIGVFSIINIMRLNSRYFLSHYILIAFLIGNLTETFLFYYSHTIWVVFFTTIVVCYRDSRLDSKKMKRVISDVRRKRSRRSVSRAA